MTGGAKRLFTSSKYLLVGVTVIGIVVMNVVGRIDGAAALDAIVWIVGIVLGATAVEDGARHMRKPEDSFTPQAVGEVVDKVGGILQVAATRRPPRPPENTN